MITDTAATVFKGSNPELAIVTRTSGRVETADNCGLLASATDYIYAVTLSGGQSVATFHGAGCETITGFTSLEFETDPALWYRMIHTSDRSAVLAQIDCILHGQVPRPLEHRIIRKDGATRWIRNVPVPQHDYKGRLSSYNGLISDITDRKRAEQMVCLQYSVTRELAESGTLADALRRILEAICQTFPWDWAAFWNYDSQSNSLCWSGIRCSATSELGGFEVSSRELTFGFGVSLPGRVWAKGQLEWIADVLVEANFVRSAAACKAGLRTGCALPIFVRGQIAGVIELFSHKVQTYDLEVIEMLTTVGVQIEQFIERKRAEDDLGSERNLLRTLVDHLPDYVYVKDTQCRFMMSNPAHQQILGAPSLSDVLGKTDVDFFPYDLALGYRTDDEAVLWEGKRIVNREETVTNKKGETQSVLTTKVPLINEEGTIIGLVGVTRDVTDRQVAREKLHETCARLAESQRELEGTFRQLQDSHEELKVAELQLIQSAKRECIGSLAAGVAHEVKNPLQTILMGLHYLTRNLPDGNEGIGLAIGDMGEAVARANKILSGLLDLAGDTETEKHLEDLNSCIKHSLYLLQHQFVAAHTKAVLHLEEKLPPLALDRGQMEQVFLNLFLNSMHAMPTGGTITITTSTIIWSDNLAEGSPFDRRFERGDSLVRIEILDSGSGIPEEFMPKVFDPFFTTKSAGEGTGLGLAVVKKIVDHHCGAIGIQNSPPGGASVTILLKVTLEYF